MPEYTKNDLPLIQECIKSAKRQMDHAESEAKSWASSFQEAANRLHFWSEVIDAIKHEQTANE